MQWLDTESGADYICRLASLDGSDFYGTCASGYSAGWATSILDLSNVYMIGSLLGQPEVWIATLFFSNESTSYPEGAYVDDLVLRKYISAAGKPPPFREAPPSSCCPQLTEEPAARTKKR